jgi:hypothetical protein
MPTITTQSQWEAVSSGYGPRDYRDFRKDGYAFPENLRFKRTGLPIGPGPRGRALIREKCCIDGSSVAEAEDCARDNATRRSDVEPGAEIFMWLKDGYIRLPD